ncbi:stage III sporulation protein AF [Longirhabdus pacifica]|uniref:stage III sporulation protein AF n=1 Tax=Longirhabdus pacifica TaxID=2305227 RepID=UPI0013E8E3FE|nr:stage III sporulation protein AF [Longirhabdus pacifica]
MIDWLSEWLREIIIIILIASFVELILPNKSMQRYTKVTISLFIILTILSPIISFIQSDFNVEQLFSEQSINNVWDENVGENEMPSLAEVMEQGNDLRTKQETLTAKWIEQQIAEEMNTQLIEVVKPWSVKDIMVKIDSQSEEEVVQSAITNVEVHLHAQEETPEEVSSGIAVVAPVKEVEEITIEFHSVNLEDLKQQESTKVQQEDEQFKAIKNEVKALFYEQWGVNEDDIVILLQ